MHVNITPIQQQKICRNEDFLKNVSYDPVDDF